MQHGAPVLVPPPRSGGRIVTDCALPSVWHGVLDGCGVLVWPLLPGACVQLPVPLPLPACCGTTHILLVTLVISYFGDFGVSFVYGGGALHKAGWTPSFRPKRAPTCAFVTFVLNSTLGTLVTLVTLVSHSYLR